MEFFNYLVLGLLVVLAGAIFFLLFTRNRSTESDEALQAELEAMREQNAETKSFFETKLDSAFSINRQEVNKQILDAGKATHDTLTGLSAKLAELVKTGETMKELDRTVKGFQQVFENPNKRGKFGEQVLNDMVSDSLPKSLYEFQYHFPKDAGSTNKGAVADCLLKLPNPPGPLVIDAKFPSQLFQYIIDAETESDAKDARATFRSEIRRLLKDIASKYIRPGETMDCALMFVPSNAIYAEIDTFHPELMDLAHEVKVYIVAPSTLMPMLSSLRMIVNTIELQKQTSDILDGLKSVAKQAGDLQKHTKDLISGNTKVTKNLDLVQKVSGEIQEKITRLSDAEELMKKESVAQIANGTNVSPED